MSDELNGGAPAPADSAPVSEAVSTPAPAETVTRETSPEPTRSMEDVMGETFDRINKPRSDDGKFKSANPVADALADTGEEPAAPETDGQSPDAETSETVAPSIVPPASLSSEMKAKFSTLPPDVQEYWAKREGESHAKITQLGQAVKQFEPVSRVLEQNRDLFDAEGVTFDAGISQIMAAQRMLKTNPGAAIQKLAAMFNYDLAAAYGAPVDPNSEVARLRQANDHQQRRLDELERRHTQREQYETQQQNAASQRLIEKFAEGKDHFDELRPAMSAAASAIAVMEPNLTDEELIARAYEVAAEGHPLTKAKRDAERLKAIEAKAKEEVEKANRLAKLNAKGSLSARPGKQTWNDTLSAAYDRIQARG